MTLTDLQRIELALPAEAMLHVVDHGADRRDPEVQRVRRLLVGTVDEALAGLASCARSLRRRDRHRRPDQGHRGPRLVRHVEYDAAGVET